MATPYDTPNCEWVSNSLALRMTDSLQVLERLYRDPDRPVAERRALAYAAGVVDVQREESRRLVARKVAPWFDESAFGRG